MTSQRFCQIVMAFLTILFFSAVRAKAIPVFEENFNDIDTTSGPVDLSISTPGSSFTTFISSNANTSFKVKPASAFFSSNYFELIDNATSGSGSTPTMRGPAAISDGSVYQLSFDFYDPSAGLSGGARIALSNSANDSSSRTSELRLIDGAVSVIGVGGTSVPSLLTYTPNEVHSVKVIGNYSTSTYMYSGGSVAPGTYDVFIDDVSYFTAGLAFRNALTSSSHISVYAEGGSSRGEVYYDNFVIQLIPEPNSIVFLNLGMLALIALHKRRRITRC